MRAIHIRSPAKPSSKYTLPDCLTFKDDIGMFVRHSVQNRKSFARLWKIVVRDTEFDRLLIQGNWFFLPTTGVSSLFNGYFIDIVVNNLLNAPPLEEVYTIVWLDAMFYRVKDEGGHVVTRCLYNVLGIRVDG